MLQPVISEIGDENNDENARNDKVIGSQLFVIFKLKRK
jgi:hypothetical protein